ncbi:MAG: hypothetical protein RBU21_17045 [FCB group bacterium]|jgi:hypothetical protein|nr:hypothetical protein [FCB group bacterium]
MRVREMPPRFNINKKAAVIGYLFGVLGGAFLTISISSMGMLGHSWDPLLYYLHTCPGYLLLVLLSELFPVVILALAAQILGFWGLLGAFASHGHSSTARWSFAMLLALQYAGVFIMVSMERWHGVGSLGLLEYIPYTVFMSCLVGTMFVTGIRGLRKPGTRNQASSTVQSTCPRTIIIVPPDDDDQGLHT